MSKYGPGEPSTYIVDDESGCLVSIPFDHYKVHQGKAFTSYFVLDIPNAGTANLLMEVGADIDGSFAGDIEFEGEGVVKIYENVTATAGTVDVPLFNRHRASTNTPGITLTYNPTAVTAGDTIIFLAHAGSGKKVGGERTSGRIYRLKSATKYLVEIVNLTTSDNYISAFLDWIER